MTRYCSKLKFFNEYLQGFQGIDFVLKIIKFRVGPKLKPDLG